MKRVFIGIELSDEARSAVAAVQDRLKEVATRQGVRFVRPEKIHLTLLFLGHMEDTAIEALCAKGSEVCATHSPFNLRADKIGGFPTLIRPKVLWVGARSVEGALERLQNDLTNAVLELASIEERDYSPHLTLARISPGSPKVGAAVMPVAAEYGDEIIAEWRVERVVLFESTPDSRYVPIEAWSLGPR